MARFPSFPWMRSAPVTSVRLRDPLAASLGLAGPEECITVSIDDVARAVGRMDPTVTRAFVALTEALHSLYRDSLPVRGEIDVEISGSPDDPVALVVARILTAVTAATPEEAPGRTGRLRFVSDAGPPKVRLLRHDRREMSSFAMPRLGGSGPGVAELLQRASRGRTSPAERDVLRRAIDAGGEPAGPPIVTVLGLSSPARSDLVAALIRELHALGMRLGAIRQSPDGHEIDHEGSDTWAYSSAGASAVAVIDASGVALVRKDAENVPLASAVALMPQDLHLVLCDGYREAGRPSVVVCGAGETADARLNEARLLASVADRMLATVNASSCDDIAPNFAATQTAALARHLVDKLGLSDRILL